MYKCYVFIIYNRIKGKYLFIIVSLMQQNLYKSFEEDKRKQKSSINVLQI